MSTATLVTETETKPEYDLALSSGGATSVLAGTGTVLACSLAGINSFRRVLGVSGGGIFGSMVSTGLTAKQVLHLAVETDFGKYVTFEDGIYRALRRKWQDLRIWPAKRAVMRREHEEWHVSGLLGSNRLGEYIRHHALKQGVSNWPEPFVTMATTKDGSQVVFNKDGVFLIKTTGVMKQIADKPVPLDLAVRASATIPGIIAAIEYRGMMLFDGSLSRDGLCPVGMQIRHFGADPKKIIACRVGEDNLSPVSGRLHRFARWAWRIHPEYHWGPETTGVIEFRPQIEHVHSLKFNLTRDEKWLAILVSFEAAAARLALEGILSGNGLLEVESIFDEIGYWRDYMPAAEGDMQVLADKVERILSEHGLF